MDVVLELRVLAREARPRRGGARSRPAGRRPRRRRVRRRGAAGSPRPTRSTALPSRAAHLEVLARARGSRAQRRGDALEVVVCRARTGASGRSISSSRPVADHLLDRGIRVGDEAARVDDDDAVGRGVEEARAPWRGSPRGRARAARPRPAQDRDDGRGAGIAAEPRRRHRGVDARPSVGDELDGARCSGAPSRRAVATARGPPLPSARSAAPALADEARGAAAALGEALAHPHTRPSRVEQHHRVVEAGESLDQRQRGGGVERDARVAARRPCAGQSSLRLESRGLARRFAADSVTEQQRRLPGVAVPQSPSPRCYHPQNSRVNQTALRSRGF